MADGKNSWRNGPEAAQLRRELREEGRRLRDELRAEWMKELAKHAEQQAQREPGRGRHQGPPNVPHRGPGRPRGNLSRERVVETAMAIMDKRGLEKVTMRAIAQGLNTGPASIYVHVRSMAELHGHMLDLIVGGIPLDRGASEWDERVIHLLRDLSHQLLRYPDLARSALEVRPSGTNTLLFAETLMGLLAEGGIPPRERALGLDLLMLWTMGGAVEHAADARDTGGQADIIAAFESAVTNEESYPNLYEVRDELFVGSEDDRFQWGVRALLTGIAAGAKRA